MKSILDPTFRYVPSTSTDIRATFRRIRRELEAKRMQAKPEANVAQLKQRKA